jgi:dienelactone hydrolase
MPSFLALLAFLHAAGVPVEHVHIPASDGAMLDAALVRPEGTPKAAAVVALHGCGGPFPSRDGSWAVALSKQGRVVLMPDSFGSRGLGSQCGVSARTVKEADRRRDAIAAAQWLSAQPGLAPAGGVDLIGWSNGGGTVLTTAREESDLPAGLFRRFVAFYPGCATRAKDMGWQPAAPLMILVGESDDWTPAPPCRTFAARFPGTVDLIVYPDAYHDFDAPNRPVRQLSGLATPPSGTGQAHAGTNEAARADAYKKVPAFLDAGD